MSNAATTATNIGLEGIVVAETRLSDVNGDAGRLILRGHAVGALAGRVTFEDACALFLDVSAAEARERLGNARARVRPLADVGGDAMEALRAALAMPAPAPAALAALAEDPFDAAAVVAVNLAAWWRRRRNAPVIPADPTLSHAADMLRMFGLAEYGDVDRERARALDAYLVTVIDHGMNASTFASRVVASTGSDLRSALCAGLGALKGPLHGGAPGPVLDLLDAVASPERARDVVDDELRAGRRIMGMGHRVYRVRDPRADVLERALTQLAERDPRTRARLTLARAVEQAAERALAERHPERALKANVELFTALILEAVGLDRAVFTGVFAASRVIGWCAHVKEQRERGRLIRPASRYVG